MTEQAEKAVILVVDDSRVIRRAAEKMLADDYTVREAVNGLEAWNMIQQDSAISVVFTDMQMPEMNGLQLLEHVRGSEDDRISALPVIMITGHDDTEAAKKEVFDLGATDFITKPFDSIDLLSRAKSYARLTQKVVELEKQTGTDRLTGLLNADSFEEHASKTLAFAQRHRLGITVVHLEIDEFQQLFLDHGKNVAQQIIAAVGKKLTAELRTEDVAARIGVARFALLLPLTNQVTALTVTDRIRESIAKLVFDTGAEKIRLILTVGIASQDATEQLVYADLVANANTALETAADTTDKVAVYEAVEPTEAPETPEEMSQEELRQAFDHIIEGNYFQIPPQQLQQLADRIAPFVEYVESQQSTHLTASGDGI